jgi:hypothetical protein
MILTLSPARGDAPNTLEKQGDTLIVNGEAFDFGFLAEGDTLRREAVSGDWLASDVTRTGGELALTVVLPHGAYAPQETRFPAPLNVSTDGPVVLPPWYAVIDGVPMTDAEYLLTTEDFQRALSTVLEADQ